jgi:WD40 repeat protein
VDNDKDTNLWNSESENKCIQTFFGHDYLVTSIKNSFGNILISGDNEGVMKIWKFETGKCL